MNTYKKNLKGMVYLASFILAIGIAIFARGSTQKVFANDAPTYVYTPSTGVNGELGQFKADGVWYYIAKKPEGSKNGKIYAAGCSDDEKEITIPSLVKRNGLKYDVLGVNDEAFKDKALKKVTIEDGIGKICIKAFENCKELTQIIFGTGLEEIGDYAFYGCEKLKAVKLPNSVKEMGSYAFFMCTSLESINCPASLTEIKDYTFEYNEALKSFDFGRKVKKIGEAAFRYCKSLKTVKFDKALTTIGRCAFKGCESLKSPKFTLNINTVGESAFAECDSLVTVKLNKKFTKIPDSCFYQCESLKTVKLSSKTVSIGHSAFRYCKKLEKVTGNNYSLKTIGDYAFEDTWHLETFNFGNVEEIGEWAFWQSHIPKADLGSKLKTLKFRAFAYSGLKEVIIPGTCKRVGKRAFEHCEYLKKVELKNGVEGLDEEAFYECSEMEDFSYPSTLHYVGSRALEGTMWLAYEQGKFLHHHTLSTPREYQIEAPYSNSFDYYNKNEKIDYSKRPDYVMVNDVCVWVDTMDKEYKTDGNGSGYWVTTYKSVVEVPKGTKQASLIMGLDYSQKKMIIPEGVETLTGMINNITEIILPDSLKVLECQLSGDHFESVILPESLETLGMSGDGAVFWSADKLSSVTFSGNKLKSIGKLTFKTCKSLTQIEIPEGVELIDDFAFDESGLQTIKLPSTLKEIGMNAFYGTQLEEIKLPNGLLKIGKNAFWKSKLKSIKLPTKIKEIGGWAFAETEITRIELPDKFEIEAQLTEDNNVTYVVKKNSKAHKAFLEFAKTWVDGYWKLKFK